MSCNEAKEISNQRIQHLREQLELYNATIAQAMNVVSGNSSNSSRGGASARDHHDSRPGADRASAATRFFPMDSGKSSAAEIAFDTSPVASTATTRFTSYKREANSKDDEGTVRHGAANSKKAVSQSAGSAQRTVNTPQEAIKSAASFKKPVAEGNNDSLPATRPQNFAAGAAIAKPLERNLSREFFEAKKNREGVSEPRASPLQCSSAVNETQQHLSPKSKNASDPVLFAYRARFDAAATACRPTPTTAAAFQALRSSQVLRSAGADAKLTPPSDGSDRDREDSDVDNVGGSEGVGELNTTSDDGASTSSSGRAFNHFLERIMRDDPSVRRPVEGSVPRRTVLPYRSAQGGTSPGPGTHSLRAGEAGGPHSLVAKAAEKYSQWRGRARTQSCSPEHTCADGSSSGEFSSALFSGDEDAYGTFPLAQESAQAAAGQVEALADSYATNADAGDKGRPGCSRPERPRLHSPGRDADNAFPQVGSTFEESEIAFERLQAVVHALRKAHRSMGLESFPPELPQVERAACLAARRDLLIQQEGEMRSNPLPGLSLEQVKEQFMVPTENIALQLIQKCEEVIGDFKHVERRRRHVQQLKRFVEQRRSDLKQREEARAMVQDEIKRLKREVDTRTVAFREHEMRYTRQIEEHTAQEKAIQDRISNVEKLSKKISSWLRILEERDSILSVKEEKLSRVQIDLQRRSDNVQAYKSLAKQLKQPPPPPKIS